MSQLPRYSCSLYGKCEQDDNNPNAIPLEQCEQKCQPYGDREEIDLMFESLTYNPESALTLPTEDRIRIINNIVGYDIPLSSFIKEVDLPAIPNLPRLDGSAIEQSFRVIDDSYDILNAIAKDDFGTLIRFPFLKDYVDKNYSPVYRLMYTFSFDYLIINKRIINMRQVEKEALDVFNDNPNVSVLILKKKREEELTEEEENDFADFLSDLFSVIAGGDGIFETYFSDFEELLIEHADGLVQYLNPNLLSSQ